MDYPAQVTTVIKNNVYRKPRLATALTVLAILAVAIVVRGYRQIRDAVEMPTAKAVPATRPNVATPRSDKKTAAVADDTGKGAPSGTSPKLATPGSDKKTAAVADDTGKGAPSGTSPKLATPRSDKKTAAVADDTGKGAPSGTSPKLATPGSDKKTAAVADDTGKGAPNGTSPKLATPGADNKTAAVADDTGKGAPGGTSPKAPDREVAVVKLAITPWGEVYVDGKQQGVSPPLRDLRIAAGEHKIEVRNPNFPSHVETVNAKAGEQIRIKHKFH